MAKLLIVAVSWLAIGAMLGSATAADEKLYTACAPMDSVVEQLDPEDLQAIGLTKEDIENAVESRLRAARLFAPTAEQTNDKEQFLYINVNITTRAHSVSVNLQRYLKDLGYGFGGYAIVWHTGSSGTHGGDGQYVLGIVSKHLDRFMASYLRVNEAHCSR